MFKSIAGVALALQVGAPASIPPEGAPRIQTVQYYRVPAHPPPCGHGWDLSARDGLCYPNGYLPPQDQAARQYRSATIGAAAIPCRAAMAPTSIAGMANATRPERFRRNFRKGAVYGGGGYQEGRRRYYYPD